MIPKLILDLCAGTGSWGEPYRNSLEYTVLAVTLPHRDVALMHLPDIPVRGILAAPPCTVFASSGARWARSDDDMKLGLSIIDACLRIVLMTEPKWWALENPVGTLRRYLGKPKLYFNPCDYGDPYTKKTCLWGNFRTPVRNPVDPIEGSKMHLNYGGRSERTKTERSRTPAGFAKAFFEANP